MSGTNSGWISKSLLPKDSSITLGSSDYPLNTIYSQNLTVTNQVTINNTDIKDTIVTIANGNTADVVNSGIISTYVTGGNTLYAGLMRYAGDSKYHLVKDTALPTSSTNLSALTKADLNVQNLNLNSGTASKLLLTDASKNLSSSTYGISDVVLTSTNQDIAGNKNFTGTTTTAFLNLTGVPGGLSININPLYVLGYNTTGGAVELVSSTTAATAATVAFRDAFGGLTAQNYTAASASQASLVVKGGGDTNGYSVFSNNNAGGLAIGDIKGAKNLITCQPAKITTGVPSDLLGCTDASSSPSGYVGEYIQSFITVNPTVGLGQWTDATSITLTAGDWNIFCTGNFYQIGASASNVFVFGVSTTAGNNNTGLTLGDTACNESTFGATTQSSGSIFVRANISSMTIYYAKYYDGGVTYKYDVKIAARRIR